VIFLLHFDYTRRDVVFCLLLFYTYHINSNLLSHHSNICLTVSTQFDHGFLSVTADGIAAAAVDAGVVAAVAAAGVVDNTTHSVTLRASLPLLNALLAAVRYTPVERWNLATRGYDEVTIRVTDDGDDDGGASPLSDSATLLVALVRSRG
jgi:hypothetical protein